MEKEISHTLEVQQSNQNQIQKQEKRPKKNGDPILGIAIP